MKKYDMNFAEAQDYASKRGIDVHIIDGDVIVNDSSNTQTIGNVLKWADEHPSKEIINHFITAAFGWLRQYAWAYVDDDGDGGTVCDSYELSNDFKAAMEKIFFNKKSVDEQKAEAHRNNTIKMINNSVYGDTCKSTTLDGEYKDITISELSEMLHIQMDDLIRFIRERSCNIETKEPDNKMFKDLLNTLYELGKKALKNEMDKINEIFTNLIIHTNVQLYNDASFAWEHKDFVYVVADVAEKDRIEEREISDTNPYMIVTVDEFGDRITLIGTNHPVVISNGAAMALIRKAKRLGEIEMLLNGAKEKL